MALLCGNCSFLSHTVRILKGVCGVFCVHWYKMLCNYLLRNLAAFPLTKTWIAAATACTNFNSVAKVFQRKRIYCELLLTLILPLRSSTTPLWMSTLSLKSCINDPASTSTWPCFISNCTCKFMWCNCIASLSLKIWHQNPSPFHMSNYGNLRQSKLCNER